MKQKSIIIDLSDQASIHPMPLRIHLFKEFTKIDFAILGYRHFTDWFSVSKQTFLKDEVTQQIYALKEAIGLPYSPQRKYITSKENAYVVSLIFEPLPIKKLFLKLYENSEEPEDPRNSDYLFLDNPIISSSEVVHEFFNIELITIDPEKGEVVREMN